MLLWDLLVSRICSECIKNRNDILTPVNFAFTQKRFHNEVKSIFSLILTTAYCRVILDFNSLVYDVVRRSRNITFSRAKLCRICMKPVVIFFLILVTGHTMQGFTTK